MSELERVVLERYDEADRAWHRIVTSQHPWGREMVCAAFVGHLWPEISEDNVDQWCRVCGRGRRVTVTYEEYDLDRETRRGA